jgi:hypothetical protein
MKDCQHLVADLEGACLSCGKFTVETSTPRLTLEEQALFERPQEPNTAGVKADIMEICHQADLAIEKYEEEIEEQRDSSNPELPKLRLIGNAIFRPSWDDIWNDVVAQSYLKATMFGYCSSLTAWDTLLREVIVMSTPTPVHK